MKKKTLLEFILSTGSLPPPLKEKLKKYRQKNPTKKITHVVVSEKRDKILGYSSSKGEAVRRLRQVEYFKHH